jgi:hypothetical protein
VGTGVIEEYVVRVPAARTGGGCSEDVVRVGERPPLGSVEVRGVAAAAVAGGSVVDPSRGLGGSDCARVRMAAGVLVPASRAPTPEYEVGDLVVVRDANGEVVTRPVDGGVAPRPTDGGVAPRPTDGGVAPRPTDGGVALRATDGGVVGELAVLVGAWF